MFSGIGEMIQWIKSWGSKFQSLYCHEIIRTGIWIPRTPVKARQPWRLPIIPGLRQRWG